MSTLIMRFDRTAIVIAILMVAASIGAIAARPTQKLSAERAQFSLELMIPKRFGEWREESFPNLGIVNPETQALLDKLYSQILNRVYVNPEGYRIMLAIAYGGNQSGSFQAHKPEVCYPAQGYTVHENRRDDLDTPYGPLPVRRLFTARGARQEPVTYWFTLGDTIVLGKLQKRLVDLRFGLTGRIPDGMLFRVSSIDGNESHAFKMQDEFVNQLLQAVSPASRVRLSGLGAP